MKTVVISTQYVFANQLSRIIHKMATAPITPKAIRVAPGVKRKVYTTLSKPPMEVGHRMKHKEATYGGLLDLHEGLGGHTDYDLSIPTFEKDTLEQEKDRLDKIKSERSNKDWELEKKKMEIKKLAKEINKEKPSTKYEPLEPVKKTDKLQTMEKNIKSGKFFDVDHKRFLKTGRGRTTSYEKFDYSSTVVSVGTAGRSYWKPLDLPLKN